MLTDEQCYVGAMHKTSTIHLGPSTALSSFSFKPIAVPGPEATLDDVLEIVFSASYDSIHHRREEWDWCMLVTFLSYFGCLCRKKKNLKKSSVVK